MGKPIEIYQVQQLASTDLRELQKMVNDLNQQLFAISQRLGALALPQSTTGLTTVAEVLTLLENAGIGES